MMGKIFINYRRGDDPGNTGRLFDRLQEVFAPEQLFLDVDNIAPGLDFVRVLNERIAECDIVLAVIGKNWSDARDATGNRRLDDPDDFVRIEIASALTQGKRVIPVLVGEAQMPRPDELPEALRPLARRNAVRLTHERYRADMQGLVKALQQSLKEIDAPRRAEAKAAMASADAALLRSFLNSYPQGADADRVRTRLRRLESPTKWSPSRAAAIILGPLAVVLFAGAVLFWVKNTSTPQPASQTSALATPPTTPASSLAPAAQPANSTSSLQKENAADAAVVPSPDEAAWLLLKDTTDDAALKRFTAQYPNSPLRKNAEARIAALAAAQQAPATTVSPIDPHELTRLLQFELKRVGCFDGAVNGEFDDATKAAWHSFTKLTSINMPDNVSYDSIKAIQGINQRVCPLVCPAGERAEGEQCVGSSPRPVTTDAAPSHPAPTPKASAPAPRANGKCFSFEGKQFCE
jgi:hypothetical protein